MRQLVPDSGGDHLSASLSKRELQVLALVCTGLSNKQIARHLQLSEGTVKQHVHHLLQKTKLQSRHQVIAKFASQLIVAQRRDETQRIAANIGKLPELLHQSIIALRWPRRPTSRRAQPIRTRANET